MGIKAPGRGSRAKVGFRSSGFRGLGFLWGYRVYIGAIYGDIGIMEKKIKTTVTGFEARESQALRTWAWGM